MVKSLQTTYSNVPYTLSMFIWITVRLDSPIWNKWRPGRLGSQTPMLLSSSCLVFFNDFVLAANTVILVMFL